jgi:hypothetical protein
MPSRELARLLRIHGPITVQVMGERKLLQPGMLAGYVMRAVTRFCQTADPVPDRRHFPYLEGIDERERDGRRGMRNNNLVREAMLGALRTAWADVQDPAGRLPYKHEHYLKTWQLGQPRIDADFILFDEAQDANPVMVAIVAAQAHAQQVWVGDSQQAIYEFTGAVNALQAIPADARAFLTQSFRFGTAVADMANRILGELDAELRLTGHPDQRSRVEPVNDPHAVLCRTNAAAVRRFLDAQAAGRRPHVVGGGTEVVSFARGALDLQQRGWTSHPDLQCFTNWGMVQDYVVQDQQGGELKLLVSLVDEFGAQQIVDALGAMPREDRANLIVSTAHKSKGREWPTVQLADDFPAEDLEPADWRLLYVAVTRARSRLDITRVAAVTKDAVESDDSEFSAYCGEQADTTRVVTLDDGQVPV